MKKFILLLLSLLLPLLGVLASPCNARQVRLSTLNWAPYIGENLKEQGYVAAITREAFARGGHTVTFSFLPWLRSIEEARGGKVDGYFPEYYSPHLTKEFAFSNPIASSPLVLFAKHGSQFAYSSIRDLIPRRLGLVKGYVNTPEIDQNPNLNKTEVLNDTINLKMLLRDRVDLIVADYHVGRYLTETELGLDPDTTLTPIYPLLANKQLYVCFPKSHPDYLDLLSDFNHGLASMRRDGTLERLKQQFKFELRNTK